MLSATPTRASWHKRMRLAVSVAVTSALLLTTLQAVAGPKEDELVEKARQTFISFMFDTHEPRFHQEVKKAKAVLIIPTIREAAVGIGGSGGDGVLVVRKKGANDWSQPAFYRIGSMSLGIKVGAQRSDAVVLVMTKKAVKSFLKKEFTAGGGDMKLTVIGGGGIATAPKGDLVSMTRSKGVLIGGSLGGAKISQNNARNADYYKKSVSVKDIVINDKVNNPQAIGLRQTLKDFAK